MYVITLSLLRQECRKNHIFKKKGCSNFGDLHNRKHNAQALLAYSVQAAVSHWGLSLVVGSFRSNVVQQHWFDPLFCWQHPSLVHTYSHLDTLSHTFLYLLLKKSMRWLSWNYDCGLAKADPEPDCKKILSESLPISNHILCRGWHLSFNYIRCTLLSLTLSFTCGLLLKTDFQVVLK